MFVKGQVYQRAEIHENYGGQKIGTISTPQNSPFILVFWDENQEENCVNESGELVLLGEGKTGDMKFLRGNKALKNHEEDQKVLHVFKMIDKENNFQYLGVAKCNGYYESEGKDKKGTLRKIILFKLQLIEENKIKPCEADAIVGINEQRNNTEKEDIVEDDNSNHIDEIKSNNHQEVEKESEKKENVLNKFKNLFRGFFKN